MDPQSQPHSTLRKPFHVDNTPSSTSSAVNLQQAVSTEPTRSRSRVSTHDAAPNASAAYPSKTLTSPESQRARNCSDSTSAVREGVGNLNRWSQSTTSLKGSPLSPRRRSNSVSRRVSTGGGSTFTFGPGGSPTNSQSSPSKSTTRPGTNSSPLPINQANVYSNGSSSPLAGPTTPTTAGLIPEAIRSTVPDYFGGRWEDSSQPKDFSVRKSSRRSGSVDIVAATPTNAGSGQGQSIGAGDPISRGHSRHRSQAGKSSSGTASSRERGSKQPSQKAMLSKALQKANTAVLLDNAQNFEGAMQAYAEACALLQQVMVRSSGDDDRRKLEAIRTTYTSRISELEKIAPHLQDEGKALPARPVSGVYRTDDLQLPVDMEDETAIIETATFTRIVNDESYSPEPTQNRPNTSSEVPRRRESLLPSALNAGPYRAWNSSDSFVPRSYSKSPMRDRVAESTVNLGPPMDSQYMPPPLSPGRRQPESRPVGFNAQEPPELSASNLTGALPTKEHTRAPSNESMSWLDTIDESGGSTASSVHSRSSSMGLRRKHIRAPSGATEAEFDAALDAAVEAAYDDGFEPMQTPARDHYYDEDDEIVANVRRKVELAKERVRQTEREVAIQDAHERERKRILLQQQMRLEPKVDDDGNESDEEERMLEEMTRGYVMDDFEFGLQSKSALPRESDSSGFSGRTWNSSVGSNLAASGTMLSPVTEGSLSNVPTLTSRAPPPAHPPPVEALPPPPGSSSSANIGNGVRSRRLSGQNPKQLKIETTAPVSIQESADMPASSVPSSWTIKGNLGQQPKTAGLVAPQPSMQQILNKSALPQPVGQPSSMFSGPSPTEIVSPPTPILSRSFTNDSDNGQPPRSGSPNRAQSRPSIRKNFSSSSLKNIKSRNLSVSQIDDGSDIPLNTPLSSQFTTTSRDGRTPAMPTLPTPISAAFKDKINGAPTGGLYLFNQEMHSPDSPGSPNPLNAGAPIPLEPCPNEFLLRPFWLMRALYQTIAHPRGGYLSTKLFVPRDVWRVKGVKIKSVEDKIANCDFLTAALMKLSQVDSFDADAVLEEMQSLESVLEQVQAILSKKLGNEVGVQGSGVLFKDASGSGGGDLDTAGLGLKTTNAVSKGSSFSWRRLRSKNSGMGLNNNFSNKMATPDTPKEGLTMGTLPMTSLATVRSAKRDVSQVQFSGPHANYMSALARLFDAAQVIDQIARQVEDPGLRHADKTQVGLELCTRHAAEFFGFYICRFVLSDIAILLDKFIKRGSEWVLV